jgi:beta-N-acetylhexosaminidase
MPTRPTLVNDAYAVLLPVFDSIDFSSQSKDFFENGGVASLLGCSRAEYVARRMSPARQNTETAELFLSYRRQAQAASGRNVIIAVDYEIGGVHRLHKLGPQLSNPRDAITKPIQEIEKFGIEAGNAARALGINLVLAPVLDAVSGENPWLLNRSLSADPDTVARISAAFIKGLQSTGVAATAKHFPGHHSTPLEPFESSRSTVPGGPKTLSSNLGPYFSAIAAGVKCVMMGPVPVEALDPSEPSSTSKIAVQLLRRQVGFGGLIISDDLDLPGTMRGRAITEVAVASLNAGVQLLLLASGKQIDEVANYITKAVQDERLPADALSSAATAIRNLADSFE